MSVVLKQLGIPLPRRRSRWRTTCPRCAPATSCSSPGRAEARRRRTFVTGKVGRTLKVEDGYEAARLAAITQLAEAELGDLDRVKRIVKVLGMVNADPAFTDQPKVINGFSDLIVRVFGERGKHARSAIGVASLPLDIAVEIEMVVEVE
ncbi:MAG: RidA family protein [Planctomycetota bacterium]